MTAVEDEQWMRRALALAERAELDGEVPVGAVLVDADGVVLGEGFNQPIGRCDPSAHAEIVALRAAASAAGNYRLPDTTLYVTVEPCAMCAGALVHARVARLVYGASEPRAGVISSQLALLEQPFFNHRVAVTGGVLAAECGQRISRFFASKRR